MKVMIVVTHLLGTGHLARALTLARAFAAAGHDAVLVSGGRPVPHLDGTGARIVQLPPLRSDGTDFTALLSDDNLPADAAYLDNRRKMLCDTVTAFQPDILITELFPFGRRVLSAEFTALLEVALALPRRPVILSSIRDILAPPSKPSRAARTDAIVARFYDAVLVHSDPNATRLEQSWPVSDALASKLAYTGYVVPGATGADRGGTHRDEVLVSAGGGLVGMPLFIAAVDAARCMPKRRWRLLVGGADADDRMALLRDRASGSRTVIEPVRPDFRQMLHHAAVSVSMCGYNTALDILQAGTPAVFVPFDAGQEVEQTLRADSLRSLGGIEVLPSRDVTPATLCDAVNRVLAAPRRPVTALKFDGAGQSVALACAMARNRA
jgi:predicted glycosyltransferase